MSTEALDFSYLLNDVIESTFSPESNFFNEFLFIDNDVEAFTSLVKCFDVNEIPFKSNILFFLNNLVAEIDGLIEKQLTQVVEHHELKRLYASWLSLKNLCDQCKPYNNVKLRLLDITWSELSRDINRVSDYEQSQIFRLIYNEEFGMPGGQPYGLLLGDYSISHKSVDSIKVDSINTLKGIAQIASAAFAPFVTNADASLFGLENIEDVALPIDFEAIFESSEYRRWNTMREMDDTRFIGLLVPKVIVPSHETGILANQRLLWGNPCYTFAAVVAREFNNYGWFSSIAGVQRNMASGGLVTPNQGVTTNSASVPLLTTSSIISDVNERALNGIGIISLCESYASPCTAFHSAPSLQRPPRYKDKNLDANARVSSMLQLILCASRFAHYIKVIIRDSVGSYTSEKECELLLENWLTKYTTGRKDMDWEMRAKFPLSDFRLSVKEMLGKPGVFGCTIYLKPHYIAEQLITELKLTTELQQSGLR